MQTEVRGLRYRQVDVFADGASGGNGLAVFWDCPNLSSAAMHLLTNELRQFESVFVQKGEQANYFKTRIFTMQEELDFAGHPLLGAAAVLHEKHSTAEREQWTLQTKVAKIAVATTAIERAFLVTMHQPRPTFGDGAVGTPSEIARWIGLSPQDLDSDLPLQVVSTGLPYLIVPIVKDLSKAQIMVDDLERRLNAVGAKFLYVYDVLGSEGRTWDNSGVVEDIATGSAAGPVAAYLCKHRRLSLGEELTIKQGRFVGRPSVIKATVRGSGESYEGVEVSGRVNFIASGVFD